VRDHDCEDLNVAFVPCWNAEGSVGIHLNKTGLDGNVSSMHSGGNSLSSGNVAGADWTGGVGWKSGIVLEEQNELGE
jgi:hypothetical protein